MSLIVFIELNFSAAVEPKTLYQYHSKSS